MLRLCSILVLIALASTAHTAETVTGRVRVIDADTWDVSGVRVRLHGIDAPERDQTCTETDGRAWTCGGWATAQASGRYQGRVAVCAALDTDRYGRIVARCQVGGSDAGGEMVAQGIAFAYLRYSSDYAADEALARSAQRGLHRARSQSPEAFRKARLAAPAAGCAIKGNLSRSGARIYHLPGQADYDRTRIDPAKGERWFCSESDARAAGWHRARR